jgi:electron transport complex protein RnfD
MRDIMFVMLFPLTIAVYYYGFKVLVNALIASALTYVLDMVLSYAVRKKVDPWDFSPIVTSLIITLLLPANVSVWLIIFGAFFAITVVKYPFGGLGNNLFNPAAAAMAMLTVGYSGTIFLYPHPLSADQSVLTQSISAVLQHGGRPFVSSMELVVGNFAGPAGATCGLIIVACLVFLIARKTVSIQIPLSLILTVAVIAFLFPRTPSSQLDSVMYELSSGYLLFAAVFMFTDPVTAPKHNLAKILYGVVGGILVMIFRYVSGYEQVVCFAILLDNA